jgi:hypothetical protein
VKDAKNSFPPGKPVPPAFYCKYPRRIDATLRVAHSAAARGGATNRSRGLPPARMHARTTIPKMQGFEAGNIDAIRSERIVCVVKDVDLRVKALQIVFGADGSLFITFPYFRHRTGILSSSSIPATGTRESQVNLEHGAKVTSHLVKYSHYTDGRAHFSQTGKIVTAIKRQSIALDKQHGHMFSLLIQGLNALDAAHPTKDSITSTERAIANLPSIRPKRSRSLAAGST